MSIKQKLIDALDCTIEDINEDRLVDILLDAYKTRGDQITHLEGENAQERERLYAEFESIKREQKRMREDPLYCATGEYFFNCNGHNFGVRVQGYRIDAFERQGNIDFAGREMSLAEWQALRE